MFRAVCELCERPIEVLRPLRESERRLMTTYLDYLLDWERNPEAPLVQYTCPSCALAAGHGKPIIQAPSILLPLLAPSPSVKPLEQALTWFFAEHPDVSLAPTPFVFPHDDGVLKVPRPLWKELFAWLRIQLLTAAPPHDLWVIVQALQETYARRYKALMDRGPHRTWDEGDMRDWAAQE